MEETRVAAERFRVQIQRANARRGKVGSESGWSSVIGPYPDYTWARVVARSGCATWNHIRAYTWYSAGPTFGYRHGRLRPESSLHYAYPPSRA